MEPESSRIVISRPKSPRSERAFTVLVDGQEKGEVRLGGDLTVDVEPGSHRVQVRYSPLTKPATKVNVKPGAEPRVVISFAGLSVVYPQDPSSTGRGALADLIREELAGAMVRCAESARPRPRSDDASTSGLKPSDADPDEPSWTVVQDPEPCDVVLEPDKVVINNFSTDTAVTHALRQSRQWTRTWSIDTERGVKITAGVTIPAHFKAQAEAVLRNQYAASAQEQQSVEHNVTVVVPPRTTTTVSFAWRRVRLTGAVTMTQRQLGEISAPFETVIGMSLDYSQSEAPNDGKNSPPVCDPAGEDGE